MPNDLLKQAIADAKAIRETAIQNAKLSLEEAFKPHLSSMLSAKLRNEIENLSEDNDASSEIGATAVTVDNPGPKKPSKASSDSSNIENPGLETDTLGEGFGDDETPEVDVDIDAAPDAPVDAPVAAAPAAPVSAPAPVAPAAPAAPVAPVDAAPAVTGMEAGAGSGESDELDLDAIIRELELDVQGDEPMAEPALNGAPTAPKMEQYDDCNAGEKAMGAITPPKNVNEEAEGVFSDGISETPVNGVNGGKKVTPGQEVTGTKAERMSEGEEIDLEEILREMEVEESAPAESPAITSENVELKRSLREHREVIQFLRSKLQEVNMLNAKLLYTNRLFKGFDLNVGQKMRVVETFDRATTVREVKLIYTTLAESLVANKPSEKSSVKKNSAKVVTEGLASKPVGSTAPKSNKTVLAEGDEMVARMQKLAGIRN